MLGRIKKLERGMKTAQAIKDFWCSTEDVLDMFVLVSTHANGRPPTPEEIEEERRNLIRPLPPLSPHDRRKIAEEVDKLVEKHRNGGKG